jgi:hypothetical protein
MNVYLGKDKAKCNTDDSDTWVSEKSD